MRVAVLALLLSCGGGGDQTDGSHTDLAVALDGSTDLQMSPLDGPAPDLSKHNNYDAGPCTPQGGDCSAGQTCCPGFGCGAGNKCACASNVGDDCTNIPCCSPHVCDYTGNTCK